MEKDRFRGFVAVGVPGEVRDLLGSVASRLAPRFPQYRFVSCENLHITLLFLGDGIERNMTEVILSSLYDGVRGVSAFELGLGAPGSFPETGTPRVLYIGIGAGRDRLEDLARKVRRSLSVLGFHEDKPFQAHITLARRKRENGFRRHTGNLSDESSLWRETVVRALGKDDPPCCPATKAIWRVAEILLMESILAPQGASYEVLGRIPLGDAEVWETSGRTDV
ncbi:MAG TPA: RNA 2',3'-cyclic phosphodiesterase [Firmicutes bacterium]|nr:RNA 2',3'-cyclic phosphodiesterase [Candidatus Fermentithermobacillaceae bacterium]